MDRRNFLRLSGLVAIPIGAPLLASCTEKPKTPSGAGASPSSSSSTSSSSASSTTSSSAEAGSLQSLVNANTGRVQVIDAQKETLTNGKRVAFGLVKENDNTPVTDATVTVYIGQDADLAPVATTRASWVQGEVASRALYVAELEFPNSGEWLLGISARLKDGTVYGGGASLQVVDTSPSPVVGQQAISVATPTVAVPLNADPLCSDVPQCPMHAISLDEALTSGKPTVLTFSAPAYCQTQTCGPVVRMVKGAVPTYGDRFNFIHVEAYDKDTPSILVPAAGEAGWKLTSEPFTFFIDGAGVVRGRLPGAFGEDELARHLEALTV